MHARMALEAKEKGSRDVSDSLTEVKIDSLGSLIKPGILNQLLHLLQGISSGERQGTKWGHKTKTNHKRFTALFATEWNVWVGISLLKGFS